VPQSVALAAGHQVWIYGKVQGLPSTVTDTWRYVVSKDQAGRRRRIRGAYPEKHLDMQEIAAPDAEEEEESPYGSAEEYVEDGSSPDEDEEDEGA
jgi:hypothetical protein